MKKISLFTVKLSVAIVLFYFLFKNTDINYLLNSYKKINLLIIIPIILYVPAIVLSALKWKIVLDNDASLANLTKISWISNFFSNFLPSTIGGDTYKVLKLKKNYDYKRLLLSIFTSRFFGILVILIISSLFSFNIYKTTNNIILSLYPLLLLSGFVLLLISIFFLRVKPRNKLTSIIFKLQSALLISKRKVFMLIVLTLIIILLGSTSLWLYYFMFGYKLPFLNILYFYCIIQLVGLIPISINSLGVTEGLMVYLFSFLFIPAEVALSIALLSRLILVLQTSFGGFLYLFIK